MIFILSKNNLQFRFIFHTFSSGANSALFSGIRFKIVIPRFPTSRFGPKFAVLFWPFKNVAEIFAPCVICFTLHLISPKISFLLHYFCGIIFPNIYQSLSKTFSKNIVFFVDIFWLVFILFSK
eukprot:UN10923